MLNSRSGQACISTARSRTSSARIWRSSGRGCTVMPLAPACRHKVAARVTLGMPRWRVLRTSATLLRLTESDVVFIGHRDCRSIIICRVRRVVHPAMVIQQRAQLGFEFGHHFRAGAQGGGERRTVGQRLLQRDPLRAAQAGPIRRIGLPQAAFGHQAVALLGVERQQRHGLGIQQRQQPDLAQQQQLKGTQAPTARPRRARRQSPAPHWRRRRTAPGAGHRAPAASAGVH